MLGAPIWSRICNVQMEISLPPLQARIMVRNTNITAKSMLSGRQSIFTNKMKMDLQRHPDLPNPDTFTNHICNNIRKCSMQKEIKDITPYVPPTNNIPKPPWETSTTVHTFTNLPASKSACTPQFLKQAA